MTFAGGNVGDPRQGRFRFLSGAVVGTLALGLVFAVVAMATYQTAQVQAEAVVWPRAGAPCPVIAQADAGKVLAPQGLSVRYRFNFEGADYGRTFGNANCTIARPTPDGRDAPACRFNAPALVTVRTRRGEVTFLPGVGHFVTVYEDPEGPHCYAQSGDGEL